MLRPIGSNLRGGSIEKKPELGSGRGKATRRAITTTTQIVLNVMQDTVQARNTGESAQKPEDVRTDDLQGLNSTEMEMVPTRNQEEPMGNQDGYEFGIKLTLLTQGISGARMGEARMRLPEFEEQFDLPATTG